MADEIEIEFEDEDDASLAEESVARFSEAVLYSSDWTVETILSQLKRNNIQLNPNFQRRDAWSNSRKSRFIESIIIGLPVPQLVLAELKGQRGKYIVLDGKQRLLSILKYTESEDNKNKGFGLSGLEVRDDLTRKKYYSLYNDSTLETELNSFLNYPIRTVIIRNWPNRDFLHQVFLRLNTGSVKLSPQELRQAMAPGPFSTFVDDFAANSKTIQTLLHRQTPDPRMRDVEILVRHVAFRDHLGEYRGRMKTFLDDVCVEENKNWESRAESIQVECTDFENIIDVLSHVFGERLAKKPGSNSFNRALFDAISFYTIRPDIRNAMLDKKERVLEEYALVFHNVEFLEAIQSDTAGLPNTVARLQIWGIHLDRALGMTVATPALEDGRIVYAKPA